VANGDVHILILLNFKKRTVLAHAHGA